MVCTLRFVNQIHFIGIPPDSSSTLIAWFPKRRTPHRPATGALWDYSELVLSEFELLPKRASPLSSHGGLAAICCHAIAALPNSRTYATTLFDSLFVKEHFKILNLKQKEKFNSTLQKKTKLARGPSRSARGEPSPEVLIEVSL